MLGSANLISLALPSSDRCILVTDHVLGRRDKFDDAMVQLCPTPPIRRLIRLRIPVKQLRHLVAQVAHAALPPGATLDERDVRVDIASATTASRNDGIADDGHRFVSRFEGAVWGENERERKLGFVEQGSGRGYGIDGASLVRGVCLGRRVWGDACAGRKKNGRRGRIDVADVGLHADEVDGVERMELSGGDEVRRSEA